MEYFIVVITVSIVMGIVFAVACRNIMQGKGYSNLTTWAVCGFLFGLITLIVALSKPDLIQQRQMLEAIGAQRKSASKATPAEELLKYKELLDMGVISQAEFEQKKTELLHI